MNSKLTMRPATLSDKTFVDSLLFMTMNQYVEATWPNNLEAQRKYYERNVFDPSNTRILQIGGVDVGRLSTSRLPDCMFIDEIHIVPEFQNCGIGRMAIEAVIHEAHEEGIPVRLTVLMVNPAQHLYLRMGFTVTAERDHRLHMEFVHSTQ